ncbi:MAG: amidohydrolase family protein [Desulfobacterales bacterium]|nr:amidohydrolase family protein [Deltaproteobacteria bacterium]NNK94597.1 amidohydrolase family protein [Desulfobacterales bacterium]
MSQHNEGGPEFRAPRLSCDSHFHVFGPTKDYPYGDDLRYTPPYAPLDEFLTFSRGLGFERWVLVQPSAYGRDNTCMLDAMETLPGCRGIVDVHEDVPDAELDKLNAVGVCGVRINVKPIKPPEPGFAATLLPRILRLDARCAELGWTLDFLLPGWLTQELMGTLRQLKSHFMLAHMGLFLSRDGVDQKGFQQLLDLLRNGEGRCWVKLTALYRMSVAPGYSDAGPMMQALVETAVDRLIWGSDHPHLSFADKTSTLELFNFFGRWVPDADDRHKILVDNPQKLFKF